VTFLTHQIGNYEYQHHNTARIQSIHTATAIDSDTGCLHRSSDAFSAAEQIIADRQTNRRHYADAAGGNSRLLVPVM
jgi:hypothetical protein